jgi:AcrR family transcriptional regulator
MPSEQLAPTLLQRAISRPLDERHASYAADVTRLVDATYAVISRTGRLDPTVREILREAGLSTQAFYRHFSSKDELLVVLLEDGRRQLTEYLARRMSRAGSPAEQVSAWIEGVLAQAVDTEAAERTRPFVVNVERLAEAFPDQQRASVAALIAPLRDAIAQGSGGDSAGSAEDRAVNVYRLVFGALADFIRTRTAPSAEQTAQIVAFALRGVGLPA